MIRHTPLLALLMIVASALMAQPVQNGVADLRTSSFDKNIGLYGYWDFYWNQLLTPNQIKDQPSHDTLYVPGPWNRQGYPTATGIATFKILLLLPHKQRDLLILFPVINASAKFWVNGTPVLETGKVSTDPSLYQGKLTTSLLPLPSDTDSVEVVVQVANFNYYSGGFGATPQLDKAASHMSQINRRNGVENFFAGSLIAMFIYQIILYFLYDRGKPYLWLALICLGVALRSMIVNGGSFLLPTLFESVDWETWKKIEFGSVYAILSFFPLYVYHLFTRFAPRWPLMIFSGTSVTLCVAVLFTPQYVYGRLLEICHIGLLFAFVYAVYVISKAWRKGEHDARIILYGVLASFPFILLEILQNSRLYPVNIDFMYLVELGVLVFLLFQVYLLSNHYAKAYRNLEKVVEERTVELVSANTVKDRLLSIMSHDIKSPLNSLKGVLHLYNRGAISKDEFGTFAGQLEGDLNKTSMLVENILYWTTSQLKGIQVNVSTFDARTVVEETILLLNSNAQKKKITVHHQTPASLEVTTDRNIIQLVLRNLLANAIKYSFEGGTIDIAVEKTDERLRITVTDYGMGMEQQAIERLLVSDTTVSTSGTNKEQGTGLGIGLCRDYLAKINGELLIRSEVGKGSAFSALIPMDSD